MSASSSKLVFMTFTCLRNSRVLCNPRHVMWHTSDGGEAKRSASTSPSEFPEMLTHGPRASLTTPGTSMTVLHISSPSSREEISPPALRLSGPRMNDRAARRKSNKHQESVTIRVRHLALPRNTDSHISRHQKLSPLACFPPGGARAKAKRQVWDQSGALQIFPLDVSVAEAFEVSPYETGRFAACATAAEVLQL